MKTTNIKKSTEGFFVLVGLLAVSFFILGLSQSYGQAKTYVHTTGASNIQSGYTVLDHPDLNNNPNAPVLYAHHLGGTGVNNKVTSLLYNASINKWGIAYEDQTPIEAGRVFTIFIAESGMVFTHTAATGNILLTGTKIDHPQFNDNPNAYGVAVHYRNGVFANFNFDMIHNTLGRYIRKVGGGNMTAGVSFRVLETGSADEKLITHTTSASNILTGYNMFTKINNSHLNNKPEMRIIFTRYAGFGDTPATGINSVFASHYEDGFWHIMREDGQPMPEGVTFDIVAAPLDDTMSSKNFTFQNVNVYPNPATDCFVISSEEQIASVILTDISGKTVLSVNNPNISEVNISNLAKGMYVASITTESGSSITKKIIKQ